MCPVIVCHSLVSQELNTVPDILLVHSITKIIVVDFLGEYLSEDCTLLASRKTICCDLLLPRDMDQLIVPWQRSLLDPNKTGVINGVKCPVTKDA